MTATTTTPAARMAALEQINETCTGCGGVLAMTKRGGGLLLGFADTRETVRWVWAGRCSGCGRYSEHTTTQNPAPLEQRRFA